MPERIFIHKKAKSMPGFKAFKDRVTDLLGDKIMGYKLKSFVTWHSDNPGRSSILISTVSVYYRSSKKSWTIFQDALLNCNASKMEK